MNFRTQQAANKRKTVGLLVGMAVLVWLVVYAALTYFGTSTACIVPIAVVTARAKATTVTTVADVAAADGMLTQALRGLLAVAEAYPDLKASTNFLALQEELSTTENKVAFSRQFYNDNVRSLNTAVKTVPTNFFAGFAKVTEREFYEVEDPQDRNAPKVTF